MSGERLWSSFIKLPFAEAEACIGVLGIQDICHFTSRDIGYFPFNFQGYRILYSISGILLFFLQNIQIQSINTNNINKNHLNVYVHDMASLSRPGPIKTVYNL